MYLIFYFVVQFFSLYVYSRLLSIVLKKQKKIDISFGILFFVYCMINEVININFGKLWLNLFSSLVFWVFIVVIQYKDNLWRKIIAVLLMLSLGVACEEISWVILNKYITLQNSELLGRVLAIFLLFSIEILLERLCNFKREILLPRLNYMIMLMIPIGSILMIAIIGNGKFQEEYKQILGVSIVIAINIFVFYLYDKILEAYEEKWKRSLLEKQVSMYTNQFALMKESEEKIRAFRHDMKHHFMMMNEYAKNGSNEELIEYIRVSLKYMEVEKKYANTGNEDVDCILNYMLDRAKKMDADVHINIKVSEEKFMSSIHLNIILSNLLENAIEALEKSVEKKLGVILKLEKGIFYISIYNSCSEEIKKDNEGFLSYKRNFQSKGIGLDNVYKVAETYNGKVEIDYQKNLFQVNVLLFLL